MTGSPLALGDHPALRRADPFRSALVLAFRPDGALASDTTRKDAERQAAEWDWHSRARPNQIAPEGNWSKWLILTGRGWGKTRTGAEWVRAKIESGTVRRGALVAPTAADARDVIVEGESGILAISPPWNRPTYESYNRRLVWPNGAIATLYSAEAPERLRGPQHDFAWGDELAAWKYVEAYDQLQFGLRLGFNPQALYTSTPKPIQIVRDLLKDPKCIVTRGSTYENRDNLSASFFDTVIGKYEGTRLGRQELGGEVLEDIEGALWAQVVIDASRMTPDVFRQVRVGRTVVAVDPSVSNTADTDETGIIAGCRGLGRCPCGKDRCAYVLRDASGQMAPIKWAREAVRLYNEFDADRVVGEVNNGGDLVETQFRVVAPDLSYKAVHASKGKRTRAEPVEALYEQARVHHVGIFPGLEDEMTGWVPDSGMPSPGRIDALVWMLSDLMLAGASIETDPSKWATFTQ